MKAVQEEAVKKERVPTQAEQIKFLKEQMPLKRLQVELQRLNTDFVELKVREYEAVHKLQEIDLRQKEAEAKQEEFIKENTVKYTVSKEDLENMPEMKEAGLVEGQVIAIPKDIYPDLKLSNKEEVVEEKPERKLKVAES